MCYHCATNPSIHHHCCRVTAISSLLSHHGVTFTVTSSRFRCCHCDVTFIVALLQCRCRSHIVAVPSLSHCHGFVVTVMVSPSSSHCCGFVVAVVVSPSHLSWFHHHCCGVTFVSVTVSSSPSWCCLCRCIVTVSLSSQCCLHCRIVAVFVAISSSLSWCRLCRCIVTVSSLRFCCRCCGVAFTVASSSPRSVIVAVTSLR